MDKNTLKYALEWFKIHDINAFNNYLSYDGSIYISVGNFEFKLCNSEVRYRAEEYKRLYERK